MPQNSQIRIRRKGTAQKSRRPSIEIVEGGVATSGFTAEERWELSGQMQELFLEPTQEELDRRRREKIEGIANYYSKIFRYMKRRIELGKESPESTERWRKVFAWHDTQKQV